MALWEKEKRGRQQHVSSHSLLPPAILPSPLDLSAPLLSSHAISSSMRLAHDSFKTLSLSLCLTHALITSFSLASAPLPSTILDEENPSF